MALSYGKLDTLFLLHCCWRLRTLYIPHCFAVIDSSVSWSAGYVASFVASRLIGQFAWPGRPVLAKFRVRGLGQFVIKLISASYMLLCTIAVSCDHLIAFHL